MATTVCVPFPLRLVWNDEDLVGTPQRGKIATGTIGAPPRPSLLDRALEKAAVDALLNAVRGGLSGTLVLRGEPGIGKTALLEYAIGSATDFRLARALGVESEMDFSFSGLHQLVVPFLPHLDELPARQHEALACALGLATGPAPDRFQVGLATLTLLATTAAQRRLLCAVDDAQWLDVESAQVLAFVARRLHADKVAFLFALRDATSQRGLFEGLPLLHIGGVPEVEARALLASVATSPVDSHVADRIITATRGNPMALLELTSELTPAQLGGASLLPEPLPIGAQLQDVFFRRLKSLPASAQTLLLLAAAEPSGDSVLLWRAAKNLGLNGDALAPAEADRLIIVGPQITFRHPLIRSAVYHSAPLDERQRIHEALAVASDPLIDPDRRAWHRAAAALGPDAAIAAELQRSADRARDRGGYAAAAAFLSRAAELTPDEHQRTERMLATVHAELISGATDRAQAMLAQVTPRLIDPMARARGLRLQGAIRYAQGQLAEAPSLLLQSARMLQPFDPRLASETMLEALQAALYGGRFASGGAASVATAALSIPSATPSGPKIADLLLSGYAALITEGRAAALPNLRRAVASLQADELRGDVDLRWFMLGCLAASELWDDEAQHALATRWVGLAREQRALSTLPVALNYLGWYEVIEGRLQAAEATLAEGREIAKAIGNAGIVGDSGAGNLLYLVWRGREAEARAAAEAMRRDGIDRGQGASVTHALSALTVLELSLGNYPAALACARDVYDEDLIYLGTLTLPDLVEAGLRSGDRQLAAQALQRFRERALACGTQWALGVLARSEALLADELADEDLYKDSVERLQESRAVTDLARAHLLYGEWLRRQGRKRDARVELRTAHGMLESMGAKAFAERAHAELVATGEHARRRTVETSDDLTPQEAQIARLAAAGARNPEIAARLFISSSTVEYHLVKVFRKLGVRSRTELAHALPKPA